MRSWLTDAKKAVQGPPEDHMEWHEGHYKAVRKALEETRKADLEER